MAFGGKEVTVFVFLVVELYVVDHRHAEQLVSLVHLHAERLEYGVGLLGCLVDGVGDLVGLARGAGQYGKVVLQQVGIGRELDHLRVNENELQL